MLEVRELHSYYGAAHVLQGVSLDVAEGQVVALLGRNGMGKTTLVRSIMGLTPPQVRQGDVRYQGKSLLGRPPYEIAQMGIGLVPQGRRVFSSLTVLEHLQIAARPPRSANGREPWTLERVFDLFPSLAERQKHFGNELSGGEQQMLAIARALMTNPDLLLMDEPSEGLAPLLVQALGEHLQRLKASGLSIFLVEQNVGLALSVADVVYVIERGQIVYRGTPEALNADEEIKRRYLGVA